MSASRQSASPSPSLRLPTRLNCHACHLEADCKRCSSCNNVWYCGRDCQRRHWPEHKSLCQTLQSVKQWSAFAEYLGGQFNRTDDEAYARAPRDLSSLPMLPHLVLGVVRVCESGQAHLKTLSSSRERPGSIPLYIVSESQRSFEIRPEILEASFRKLFGGQSLDTVMRRSLPVAVKRSYLHESGFHLPSAAHPALRTYPLNSEPCVFVLPSAEK